MVESIDSSTWRNRSKNPIRKLVLSAFKSRIIKSGWYIYAHYLHKIQFSPKKSNPVIYSLKLPSPHVPVSSSKVFSRPCRWGIIFHYTTSFLTDETSEDARYSIATSMGNFLRSYIPWLHRYRFLHLGSASPSTPEVIVSIHFLFY